MTIEIKATNNTDQLIVIPLFAAILNYDKKDCGLPDGLFEKYTLDVSVTNGNEIASGLKKLVEKRVLLPDKFIDAYKMILAHVMVSPIYCVANGDNFADTNFLKYDISGVLRPFPMGEYTRYIVDNFDYSEIPDASSWVDYHFPQEVILDNRLLVNLNLKARQSIVLSLTQVL